MERYIGGGYATRGGYATTYVRLYSRDYNLLEESSISTPQQA
jgi:hypothetical protein